MEKFTTAEIKYLLAAETDDGVAMVKIGAKLGVSKASVFHMVERLERKGLVEKQKKIVLTEAGKKVLSEFHSIMDWMRHHLVDKCGVPEDIAYEDSIGVICALSDVTREKAAAVFAKSGLYGNRNG